MTPCTVVAVAEHAPLLCTDDDILSSHTFIIATVLACRVIPSIWLAVTSLPHTFHVLFMYSLSSCINPPYRPLPLSNSGRIVWSAAPPHPPFYLLLNATYLMGLDDILCVVCCTSWHIMCTLNVRTCCMLYLSIVLNRVASAVAVAIAAVYGEWVGLRIVGACTWFYEQPYFTNYIVSLCMYLMYLL